MRPATIYDVARRAGVSHQTVTRYLQGFEGIRPATRERVAEALTNLEYRPNTAARLLRSRETNRIGVLADSIDATGPARILHGASELARERGYVLDVVVTDGSSAKSVATSLAMLTEHQVAGILVTAQTEIVLNEMRRQSLTSPLVIEPQIGAVEGGPTTSEIAGQLAADHLLDFGHRELGYISGPNLWLSSKGRRDGFLRRVAERGGTVVWVREGDWSARSGHEAWESLADSERKVTAIAAANDSMAIGLISAAYDSGVNVPSDLSVLGNDDAPESKYLLPSLSTIAMDFEGEGRLVLGALIRQIEGTTSDVAVEFSAPIVIARASTAPRVSSR